MLNADETGHRTNGAKRWLWTLVAPTFVFYTITTSRGADVLRRLLGARFGGVLGSDRLSTYTTYASGHHQFCWAHFTRNLLSARDLATTAAAQRFCREALALQRRLFRLWHRFRGDPDIRGGPITRDQLIAKAEPVEQAFFALGERYVNAATADVSNLARALFVHHPHFFTFLHEDGVEPTNNVAERALRTAVQWRKMHVRQSQPQRRAGGGAIAHRHPHVPVAAAQRARLSDGRHSLSPPRSNRAVTAAETPNPLNCYLSCHVWRYGVDEIARREVSRRTSGMAARPSERTATCQVRHAGGWIQTTYHRRPATADYAAWSTQYGRQGQQRGTVRLCGTKPPLQHYFTEYRGQCSTSPRG